MNDESTPSLPRANDALILYILLFTTNEFRFVFCCKITPSKCNFFARWFLYIFFSVFSIHSILVSLNSSIHSFKSSCKGTK